MTTPALQSIIAEMRELAAGIEARHLTDEIPVSDALREAMNKLFSAVSSQCEDWAYRL